jgi:hypothetical protein
MNIKIGLGVGILVEGLIGFTMLYICPFVEAISSFLTMLVISAFIGVIAFFAYTGHQKRSKGIRE